MFSPDHFAKRDFWIGIGDHRIAADLGPITQDDPCGFARFEHNSVNRCV